jgi:SIR2-like domain
VIDEELVRAVRDHAAILFVGAGVSMNLGLPGFGELIDTIAEELQYDSEIFSQFASPQELAEFYVLQQKRLGPLRSQLDRQWHAGNVDISKSLVHRLIVDLEFPLIYTTNYDRWLELAFDHWDRPFVKVASVSDLRVLPPGVTQIVKFHGDFDDDDSLVLTESSYFERLDLESPLDIKLRADAMGRTVLFIGHRLADINVRLLLYRLSKVWGRATIRDRPRSFIVKDKPNPVHEAVLKDRGVTPIVTHAQSPGEGLAAFLSELLMLAFHRSLPVTPAEEFPSPST